MWKSGNAAVHGLLWRPAERQWRGTDGRARSTVGLRARRSPTGTRACSGSCNRATQCCSRTTAARRATASPTATRSTAGGVSVDVADVAAGIKHAIKEGWAIPSADRGHGWERGRIHRVERRRAPLRSRRRGGGALSRHRSARPRGDDAPLRIGRPDATGRTATGRRETFTSPARRSRTLRSCAPRCCCCRATKTAWSIRRAPPRSPTRCSAPVSSSSHHVYAGEGHGWRRAGTVADELARLDDVSRTMVLTGC